MKSRLLSLAALGLLTLSCTDQPLGPDAPGNTTVALARSGPPMIATVVFGRNDRGTEFFPPGEHDGSFHAKDAIRPRAIVIAAGGTVDFVVDPFHKPAVYEPGISPDDIDTSLLEPAGAPFPFPPIINDPEGRIARGTLVLGGPTVWSWTFTEPGRYLVICEVFPHFSAGKMYAWVIVK